MKQQSEKTKKRGKTLYQWFGIIGDIIFVPVIIITLISVLIIFLDRQQNKVPNLFGYSYVRIMSNSMEKDYGFTRGDGVFLKKTNTSELWVGDVIAFYTFYDTVDAKVYKKTIESQNQQIEINPNFNVEGRCSLEYGIEHSSKVTFHQIVEVKVDEGGTRFFVTKGTSNASYDYVHGVREDFVIGKYVESPAWLTNTFSWVASSQGMIVMVCVPLFILIIFQSLSLIEQLNLTITEKKLISGKIPCLSEDAKKMYQINYLDNVSKVILIGNNKSSLAELSPLLINESDKEKQQDFNSQLKYSIALLQKGEDEYWDYWNKNLKTKSELNMLGKYRQKN